MNLIPLSLACTLGLALVADATAAASCVARSGPRVPTIVELYTSEGCNSCPPADQWLSGLAERPDVVGLAFHVDYWDRLGWTDRFASAAWTKRQHEQLAVNGARFAYTPQVVVDGHDRTDWPRVQAAASRTSTVAVELAREGDQVRAAVTPGAERPQRLAAYWAVTEFGHRSVVKAGENDGKTLHHDFVVRALQPVGPWNATAGVPQALVFTPPAAGDTVHARRVNLVVLDAATGRPVQALALGC
jgi:hypothetical protein